MKRGLTGHYQTSTAGGETIRAFIPKPLPPQPPLEMTDQRQRLLERAEGDWESWLDFFLDGVEQTAANAVETTKRLVALFQ